MAVTTKSVLQDDDVTVKRVLPTNMTGDSMKSTLSSIKALVRSKYQDTATSAQTKGIDQNKRVRAAFIALYSASVFIFMRTETLWLLTINAKMILLRFQRGLETQTKYRFRQLQFNTCSFTCIFISRSRALIKRMNRAISIRIKS